MATNLVNEDVFDYKNKTKIYIETVRNISGDNMKTIQDAINIIIETASKYYVETATEKS